MPRGPKGEKRPRDANQLAKLTVDIATGQVEDREPTENKFARFGEVQLGVLDGGSCQALHKGNAKLKSKLVAGFELDTVAGFHNWVSTHQ
jgi:hypothetical protein